MRHIDTHSHLFLPEFDQDRDRVVRQALLTGVEKMILPNVDRSTFASMMAMVTQYPDHTFPAMGVHPSSVKEDYRDELAFVEKQLQEHAFIAVGEIGLDLYWDKTFFEEQKKALEIQVNWAKSLGLPVIIHVRDAFEEIMKCLKPLQNGSLKGVFHCFSGSYEQAQRIIDLGFLLGIGGVVTFKNSKLPQTIEKLALSSLVTETDAPYITPHPHRGTRNESSYIPLIVEKIAEIKQQRMEETATVLFENAEGLFFVKP